MSRRKQKRPQHLVNADPGGPKLLSHGEENVSAGVREFLSGIPRTGVTVLQINVVLTGLHINFQKQKQNEIKIIFAWIMYLYC